MAQYEQSLKYYRDMKNVIDTSFDDGKIEKAFEVARNALLENLPVSVIVRLTGLSEEEINALSQ